ncbi:sulfate permease [Nocardioides piscis]|uniref:Sulfate permease n=1 Tax=Nocardioides piscis TaxID=2714938 RepID=A0A6G7YG46_9ACTN|nr:sulfate permease [Nocardioides piscis]QIK75699.1 sulfate permease [Nocardioides piscis]
MLALLWNISAAIRGYLRFYMPTNRALDWLRTPRGLKWAIPIAVVGTPLYLYAMSIAAVISASPGFGWMNVLVIIFLWNALKFAWVAVLAPLAILRPMLGRGTAATS